MSQHGIIITPAAARLVGFAGKGKIARLEEHGIVRRIGPCLRRSIDVGAEPMNSMRMLDRARKIRTHQNPKNSANSNSGPN